MTQITFRDDGQQLQWLRATDGKVTETSDQHLTGQWRGADIVGVPVVGGQLVAHLQLLPEGQTITVEAPIVEIV